MPQSTRVEKDAQTVMSLVPKETPVRLRWPLFDGGMRNDKAPADLKDNELVYVQNLQLVAGELAVANGYAPFGSMYNGQAQVAFQAFYPDGSIKVVLVTTETIYVYVPAALEWQLVSYGAAFTTTGDVVAGANVFPVDAVTGMAPGSLFGVILDDGTQLQTSIDSIATLDVTTIDPVPAGGHVTSGAAVSLGTALNGDVTGENQVNVVEFPANGWVIISNAIDPLIYFFGGVVLPLPGLPTNTTCHAMIVAHEQLLIANTVENGTDFPQRLRASDQADPTQWTPGNGLAAVYNLLDTEDFINQLLILGPWVIVYREQSIMRGSYLGLPNETWFWEYMIYGEGGISQQAASEIGAEHAFVGNAGLYQYNGGYELQPFGDAVFFDFLSNNGELNPEARTTVFTQYIGDYDEFWILYPTTPSIYPNTLLRSSLENTAWFHRTLGDEFFSITPVIDVVLGTWQTTPGLWSEHSEQWDSRIFTQNVPNFLMSPVYLTHLQLYDYSTPTDNGKVIPWFFVTKQYGEGLRFTRWERLYLTGVGEIDTVEYSINEGKTWTLLETGVELGEVPGFAYVYIDHSSTRIQFRMSGVDPSFQLRYGWLEGVLESDW